MRLQFLVLVRAEVLVELVQAPFQVDMVQTHQVQVHQVQERGSERELGLEKAQAQDLALAKALAQALAVEWTWQASPAHLAYLDHPDPPVHRVALELLEVQVLLGVHHYHLSLGSPAALVVPVLQLVQAMLGVPAVQAALDLQMPRQVQVVLPDLGFPAILEVLHYPPQVVLVALELVALVTLVTLVVLALLDFLVVLAPLMFLAAQHILPPLAAQLVPVAPAALVDQWLSTPSYS